MKIAILPSARNDLAEGFRFYERQQPGLGGYFLESLFSDIDSLQLYAGIHRKIFGVHRLLSKRFPFAVYYSGEAGVVFVWAVLDCRREPQRNLRKLKRAKQTGGQRE
jgi:plasmid stabilization system protein ParE